MRAYSLVVVASCLESWYSGCDWSGHGNVSALRSPGMRGVLTALGGPTSGPRWGRTGLCSVLAVVGYGWFVFWVGSTPLSAEGNSSAAEKCPSFHEFVVEPPWIRRIEYRRSQSYREVKAARVPTDPPVVLPRLFVLNEAVVAWQPKGWYMRHLFDATLYSVSTRERLIVTNLPPPGLEGISGANQYYYWQISPGHQVVGIRPRPGQPGYTPYSDLPHVGFEFEFRRFLRLGLDLMGVGPFRWLNREEFEVEPVAIYRFPNPGGRGRITAWDERGRPLGAVYRLREAPPGCEEVRVTYRYRDAEATLPWEFLAYQRTPTEGEIVHTNYLDKIELGLDPEAPDGYYPEQFRAAHVPLARLIVVSNDIRYEVRRDGRLEKIPDVPYTELPTEPSRAMLRWILASCLAVCLVGWAWVWWWVRRRAAGG